MRVVYYDIYRSSQEVENELNVEYCEFDEVLKESDFGSIHVPATKATYHFIGERECKLMKPTAILINTAWGIVVDEKALLRVFKEKWIQGAGIDV